MGKRQTSVGMRGTLACAAEARLESAMSACRRSTVPWSHPSRTPRESPIEHLHGIAIACRARGRAHHTNNFTRASRAHLLLLPAGRRFLRSRSPVLVDFLLHPEGQQSGSFQPPSMSCRLLRSDPQCVSPRTFVRRHISIWQVSRTEKEGASTCKRSIH